MIFEFHTAKWLRNKRRGAKMLKPVTGCKLEIVDRRERERGRHTQGRGLHRVTGRREEEEGEGERR